MSKQRDIEMAELYPTPISTSWMRCRNCRWRPEYREAVQHLASVTLQMVQALVTGFKLSLVKRSVDATIPNCFERAMPWGTADSIFRNMETVRPHISTNLLPGRCKSQSYPFLMLLPGCVEKRTPTHFLEVLEVLAQVAMEKYTEEQSFSGLGRAPWDDHIWESDLWTFLTRLISEDLAFLKHWLLFAVPNELSSAMDGADKDVIELRGFLPTRKTLAMARGLSKGRVYGLPKGGTPVSLHPFCIFARPTFMRKPEGNDSACCRLPEELLLLSFHDAQHVLFQASCTRVVVPRNDLADLATQMSTEADTRMSHRWTQAHWGYVCLSVEKMRELNHSLGFAAGDELLAALDKAAAIFASDRISLSPCGAPKLFPFWCQADMLFMPFLYPSLSFSETSLVSLVMATISKIIVDALHDWEHALHPRFNVFLDTRVWQRDKTSVHHLDRTVFDAIESVRHSCKVLRLQECDEPSSVLWMARDSRADTWHYCSEAEFCRTSTAAFGLIRRKVRGQWQFLLCWNPTHGGLNFPGGHAEKQDNEDPRLTLQRELWEELGMAVESTTAQAVFDGPLRALRKSMPNHPLTAYEHYFFLLDGQDLKSLPDAEVSWQWVSVAELQRGETNKGKPIRSFPFELLQSFVKLGVTVKLPLSSTEYSDCAWTSLTSL